VKFSRAAIEGVATAQHPTLWPSPEDRLLPEVERKVRNMRKALRQKARRLLKNGRKR